MYLQVNLAPASPHLQQLSQDALLDDWFATAHWQVCCSYGRCSSRVVLIEQAIAAEWCMRIT